METIHRRSEESRYSSFSLPTQSFLYQLPEILAVLSADGGGQRGSRQLMEGVVSLALNRAAPNQSLYRNKRVVIQFISIRSHGIERERLSERYTRMIILDSNSLLNTWRET